MIDTLEDIRAEQQLRQATQLLEALPLEARINFCAKALLLAIAEMQQKRPQPLGTAAYLILSRQRRPLATLLAFAGAGASEVAEFLARLIQDVKSAETQLARGNGKPN